MSSFFPDAIISWNNVLNHFNDIPSFSVLKNHILSLIRPKKKCIFGIHDPFGTCTPSDKCFCNQGIEDTDHFLFLCPFLLLDEQPYRLM